MRIYGPGATVAQDLEPEYIAVSRDSRKAWVTLQENNALAVVDVKRAQVKSIFALGSKDHSLPDNALDANNKDGAISIADWPAFGMYQPDAIASYTVRGKTYLLTANEGDARGYTGFSEEARVEDLPLDPAVFPDAAVLQAPEKLGRLKITTEVGDADGDGLYEEIYAYGARSFSIWDARGKRVYDSASEHERVTAAALPADFNSTNDENGSFDDRSDDKGPEPEGLLFIPAFRSPNRRPLLVVGNEVSGTTTIFQVKLTGKPRRNGADRDDDNDDD